MSFYLFIKILCAKMSSVYKPLKRYLIEISVQETNFKLFRLKIMSKLFTIGLLGDEDQNGSGGSELDQMFEQPIPLAAADGHHFDDLLHVLASLADLTLRTN